MPLKVMDLVEQRLAVVLEPGWSGRSVTEVCARHGISRDTFYAWRRRYLADGLAGLESVSRRPHRSPTQLAPQWEDQIVRLRKRHGWGPAKIRDALRRDSLRDGGPDGGRVPAASTVQQVLARRGLTGQPRQRRAAPRPVHRFERAASNELWQIDGAFHTLADGGAYWSVEILDDHSRYCPVIAVGAALSGTLAWTALRAAVAANGLPGTLLSDNGRCFTGRLDGQTVTFERRVREAGIQFAHARPYHPQTCGKVERLHRTEREWLARHDVPATLEEARQLLERFRCHYNQHRPHESLAGQAPVDCYRPGTGLTLPQIDLEPADYTPPGCLPRKTSPHGRFSYARRHFDLGERWAGITVGVLREHGRLHVFYGSTLIDTYLVGSNLPTPTR